MANKSKTKARNKKFVTILGIKIDENNFAALIIGIAIFTMLGVSRIYDNNKLEHGRTELVCAEIIDVGIRTPGGLGVKNEVGYIKFRYYIENREFTQFTSSFQIKKYINRYHVGDCIEVLVSLENKNVWRWNESKGSFKCHE